VRLLLAEQPLGAEAVLAVVAQVVAADAGVPAGALQEAGEQLDQGGLAGARGAGEDQPRPGQGWSLQPRGRQALTTLPTAVIRNSWPVSASSTAKVWPGLPAGTRLP
jgi:hypothetical protein